MTSITPPTMGFRRRVDSHPGPATNRPHGDVSTPTPSTSQAAERETYRPDAASPLRKAAIVLMSLEQSTASQLLSHLDRAAVEAVTWEIARIARIEPEEQELVLGEFYGLGLRRHYFAFEDLSKMSDEDIRRAYHAGDARTWALSLASASPPLRAKVLDSLQPAAAQSLRQTLHDLGPFRLADAEAAQMEITDRFRDLADQGVIVLPEPSGRDDLLA
jgi:flagellar motor switch protein FliG